MSLTRVWLKVAGGRVAKRDRIVARGRDYTREAPPWLALVENYGVKGSGVLISPKVLLSAAHVTPTSSVSTCRDDLSSVYGAIKFRVERVIRHPGYVSNKTHTVKLCSL